MTPCRVRKVKTVGFPIVDTFLYMRLIFNKRLGSFEKPDTYRETNNFSLVLNVRQNIFKTK